MRRAPYALPSLAILSALVAVGAPAAVIDDFSGGASAWAPTLQYGRVDRCVASAGEGGSLRLDYAMEDTSTNHVLFARDASLDLSTAESISFSVRGVGDPVSVFFFLIDARGRLRNYGPHGTNYDFNTGYADWHACRVTLDRDHSVQGGDADLSEIRRVGFFLWHEGPAQGTAWFDDLAFTDAAASVSATPSEVSPNGDGVYDTCRIKAICPRGINVTLDILDPGGRFIAHPVPAASPGTGRVEVSWDPTTSATPCPPGIYTVRAMFRGDQTTEARAEFRITSRDPWPAVSYRNEPFFPVGAWFEGAPSFNGCPTDPDEARAWYDRAFADLARHQFNAVAVPNCPETHWDALLRAAEAHGVRVILEVGPLVGLVSSPEPLPESELARVCGEMATRLSHYPALLRYQIRDEPPADMVPSWILVQRVMAALDPRHPAFSCFCSPESLGKLVRQAPLTEACFDIYPHRQGMEAPTLGGFRPTLDLYRREAGETPPWIVLQSFGIAHSPGSWRYPTPVELRAVTYLSLAARAQGIFYFIYNHMPGYLDGLVASDGTPQPLYPAVSELASELRALSPILGSAIPADAPTVSEGEGPESVGETPHAVASAFTLPGGRRGLTVASADLSSPCPLRVKTPDPSAWVDALTGEALRPTEGWLQVTLAPGQGRVLLEARP